METNRLARRAAAAGFIHQIGEVSTGKAGCAARNGAGIDIRGQRRLFHVDFEDFLTTDNVGIGHDHLAIETPQGAAVPGPKHPDGWLQR